MITGKYIVLEGPEGVGKTTQLHELARRLQAAGLPVRTLREPDSQSDLTARAIRQLTQDPRYPMNTRTEVLLYNAARSQSLEIIKQSLAHGVFCLVDRNYLTTLAIQYYGRGDVPDYQVINNIINFAVAGMEPDLCILLDAPVNTLQERLQGRYHGERFDNLDSAFLERVRAGYLWEAHQRKLPVVFATDDPSTVADNIWKLVSQALAVRQPSRQLAIAAPAVSVKEIIAQKTLEHQQPEQPAESEPIKLPAPDTPAQDTSPIMATQAYGDTAQLQLSGACLTVEAASSLLVQRLASKRRVTCPEPPIAPYYDQKDEAGRYRYYTPGHLEPAIKQAYQHTMDEIFTIYADMVRRLTDYIRNNSSTLAKERDIAWKTLTRGQAYAAAQAVLPAAIQSTVNVFASGEALEQLIINLRSDVLQEARQAADQLSKDGSQNLPLLQEHLEKPDERGAVIAYRASTAQTMKQLVQAHLPDNYAASDTKAATLVDFWPKNELLLVADMLYEHSNLPLEELQSIVGDWTYDQKTAVFKSYMGKRLDRRHRPGRALEKAHYSWDLVCDYATFCGLQRHHMVEVDDLNWQRLTPRYGYDIPKLIEDAGLTDEFETCFDLSLKLYGALQHAGHTLEAQYATLLGHKLRWKVTYNARQAFHLHELRTSSQGHPDYRQLILQMHEKLAEVHPLIADAMRFVNTDESPELTRLAAERYTQFKLSKQQ